MGRRYRRAVFRFAAGDVRSRHVRGNRNRLHVVAGVTPTPAPNCCTAPELSWRHSALNVVLVAFFKLTSSGHTLVFDYHNYAFEMLRGSHNTLGVLWQLPVAQTVARLSFRCMCSS